MTPSSAIEERRTQAAENDSIRPFVIDVPEAELTELRRRIDATRWPERETVPDDSQGVPSSLMRELARYWATEYNWRACEKKLNALPQFITEIDGLDIHFVHVRSKHKNALPLIITHGWPGSTIGLDVDLPAGQPRREPCIHAFLADRERQLVVGRDDRRLASVVVEVDL
ncbi:MAG TPA: epoxide hydrolase N-terminal domain-containing protein, partial [Vicinamibacterales bacterium]|nr:epoxide hydrolase N-terminal domain-containing protein [Vicinamibacterales bacterium]